MGNPTRSMSYCHMYISYHIITMSAHHDTATIGRTGRPVMRRMKPIKREKNRRRRVAISTDWPQYLHFGWGTRHNQPCNFFWKSKQADPEIRHFPLTLLVVLTTLTLPCEVWWPTRFRLLPKSTTLDDLEGPLRKTFLQRFCNHGLSLCGVIESYVAVRRGAAWWFQPMNQWWIQAWHS